MLNVKKTLTKILDALKVDFIVEEGTNNSWEYRKWNSGIAECWYANNFAINFDTQIVNNLRTSTTISSVALPSILLSVTELNTSGYNPDNAGWVTLVTGTKDGSDIKLSYMGWALAGNDTINANIYVKGTWK